MEEQVQQSVENNEKFSKHWGKTFAYVVVLLLVAAATGGAVYVWQHGKVKSLTGQNASLSSSNKSLTKDDNNLKTSDTNLVKTLQQFQLLAATNTNASSTTKSSVSNSSVQSNVTPAPVGKFVINSVKIEPTSDFNAQGGTVFPSGQTALVANVTITNLTSSIQSYNLFQFYGTTKTGVVVDPTVYGNGFNPGIWNNSQITAGGSQTVNILFTPRMDLTTLNWAPPSGSAISAKMPSPTSE